MSEDLEGVVLTPAEREVVHQIRMRGFAVCIFNPVELETADSQAVEDRLVELGWEVIGDLK